MKTQQALTQSQAGLMQALARLEVATEAMRAAGKDLERAEAEAEDPTTRAVAGAAHEGTRRALVRLASVRSIVGRHLGLYI